jgi:hypothetical protein
VCSPAPQLTPVSRSRSTRWSGCGRPGRRHPAQCLHLSGVELPPQQSFRLTIAHQEARAAGRQQVTGPAGVRCPRQALASDQSSLMKVVTQSSCAFAETHHDLPPTRSEPPTPRLPNDEASTAHARPARRHRHRAAACRQRRVLRGHRLTPGGARHADGVTDDPADTSAVGRRDGQAGSVDLPRPAQSASAPAICNAVVIRCETSRMSKGPNRPTTTA